MKLLESAIDCVDHAKRVEQQTPNTNLLLTFFIIILRPLLRALRTKINSNSTAKIEHRFIGTMNYCQDSPFINLDNS